MDVIIQIITAFIGSLGFGMVFNVRYRHLIPAALSGMFTWMVYLATAKITGTIFLPSMLASAFAAMYGEILARIRKTPANQFLIIGLIPLVPGSTLYYMMSYAVQGDWVRSRWYGTQTVRYALGIAVGISLVWAFWDMVKRITERMKII